jgi:STE24 endopeptidase
MGNAWGWVNLVYLAATLLAYTALMFPLTVYSDFVLEHRFGQSNQSFRSWCADAAKATVLELFLTCGFFSGVYALLTWAPGSWWLWATLLYVLISVLLSAVGPILILPLFYKVEPVDDPELQQHSEQLLREAGLRVLGIFRWGLREKTRAANAALAGLGQTRRIILSDTLLDAYSRQEILAVLAHEAGHVRNRDIPRMLFLSTGVAGTAFLTARVILDRLVVQLGYAAASDIAAFPLLLLVLAGVSLAALPLVNGYSRHREFAADAYAVERMGSAEPLVSALRKLGEQNLSDPYPPAWAEFLLFSHPSLGRRIVRAHAAGGPNK